MSSTIYRGLLYYSKYTAQLFSMVLGDTAGATFFPWYCSGDHRCSHNGSILTCVYTTRRAVQNLIYECGNVPQTTADRYIVLNICSNPSICPSSFPHAYNSIPLKWLKLFNRSTYSSAGHGCTLEWMLQRLFTSESITVTAWKVKREGAKARLLKAIWLPPMTVTNESLTLQPLSMHILYPGANEHRHWGCCIFSVLYWC